MSVTKNPGGIVEIHQAWLCDDETMVRFGCVFGLVDNDPQLDIVTSPVVSYFFPDDETFVDVRTKSNSLYRIVNLDDVFVPALKKYMDRKNETVA